MATQKQRLTHFFCRDIEIFYERDETRLLFLGVFLCLLLVQHCLTAFKLLKINSCRATIVLIMQQELCTTACMSNELSPSSSGLCVCSISREPINHNNNSSRKVHDVFPLLLLLLLQNLCCKIAPNFASIQLHYWYCVYAFRYICITQEVDNANESGQRFRRKTASEASFPIQFLIVSRKL